MDEQVTIGAGSSYPLDGILALPEDLSTKIPAVVLVQGSGPQDKDETVEANKPFRDIAEYLKTKGIATLRYDKRTLTYGKQMTEAGLGDITVEGETIEDALAAHEILRADPRINPGSIYLLGHSLGGMLAPRIDAESSGFAGIIIMAGSPRTLAEIIIEQSEDVLSQLGKVLRKIGEKQVASLRAKLDAIATMSDEEARHTKAVGKSYAWYFKEMSDHPTAGYLDALTKPVLILQGEKDFQVSPERDFQLYQQLCAGKENFQYKLYPGLNHLFMKAIYPSVKDFKKEYEVAQHVDPQVLSDLADWILGRNLSDLAGNIQFFEDYDYKAMR